jgi:flagellar hook-basal body complex protein FliE
MMSDLFIPPLTAVAAPLDPAWAPRLSAATPSGNFGAWFSAQLAQVNRELNTAELDVQRLAAGENVAVHDVMLGLEHAKMSLQLVMQVRTVLLEGYQEMMRMAL